MKITSFFEAVLQAPLANPRWSWGAIDATSNRVFLRVWEDQIEPDVDGRKVQVYWNQRVSKSLGYEERLRHLKALNNGAQGIGILCNATDPQTCKIRKIARFDDKTLLELGTLSEDERGVFARITRSIPIIELASMTSSQQALPKDISEILSTESLSHTTKEALVDARIGQGAFRKTVLGLWNNRCAVTGSAILAAIRASHIKPWRDSRNTERLDPRNGLPLIAGYDALFDAGLISFDDSGVMIVSSLVADSERGVHGLVGKALRRKPDLQTIGYLKYHRSHLFQK